MTDGILTQEDSGRPRGRRLAPVETPMPAMPEWSPTGDERFARCDFDTQVPKLITAPCPRGRHGGGRET